MHLISEFEALVRRAEQELATVVTAADLERAETALLGRKGALAQLMEQMKTIAAHERPVVGQAANTAKQKITTLVAARTDELRAHARGALAQTEWIDTSAPGTRTAEGSLHLMTQAIAEIAEIFTRLGFVRTRYPEIDYDHFVFEALNMPPNHPARDDWETFFIDASVDKKLGRLVLTPHTSNGQIHELTRHQPPIRMINIAKCYRRQIDVTHVPMFHQFEGLVVDRGISVAHLKGTLDFFAREFFGADRSIRLRPHHFRFTEPSFEIDISCGLCGGCGCRTCKQGWLELGGAGMVHPNVLTACGVDPKKFTGFAFGWGVERTFMMKSGLQIPDMRELYKNDVRFLAQF